ncbi:retrovirus-related pol polyprotein from transposon TNT 1-94 [Tanacetum coccineum]
MENEIDLEKKIKELYNILFKVGQSAQTVHVLTKPQAFYDNIHKQALGYQNPFHLKKAQWIKPTLYDGIVMSDKHVSTLVIYDEETLILEEESRSKMSEKAKDPEVNESLKKLKFHLDKFDNVVKIRTTPNARTEDLLNEIIEVKTVFDQMGAAVQQSLVEKQCLEIAKKELLLENDRLLQQIMSQEVLITVMNSMIEVFLIVVSFFSGYLDSGCSKHMTRNHSQLMNFVSKFLGTVRFGNDHISRIMGYGDFQLGNVTISRVYYVEGLGHNLFSVGQFCDGDLEVAFQKNTCFIRNLEGVDLLSGSRDTRKSKKSFHQPKAHDTNQEKLYLLHMDLCVPMHVASINGKRYILVIVDDYSRFTWVRFLRTKDEAPKAIIKCIKNIQVCLNATVCNVRTNNGTEFVNQTLRKFYENVGISHQTSVARTPQQNGVVERRNQTLIEVARTMLIFSKAPLFLWAEAINTASYTQNRSIIRRRYNKTSYELMQDKKPDLSFFHVFGTLCYPTNDNDDLSKLDAKDDVGIFVGYAPAKKAIRIYNKRTQKIIKTIHVTFDELTAMASKQFSLGLGLKCMTPATSSLGLVLNPVSQQPCIPPKRDDWDYLFQPMFDEYFTSPAIAIPLV